MGVLTVVLIKLTDLKDSDGPLNHPDPYVMLELKKDGFGPFDTNKGKQQSTTKKGTCNPVYNETFTFNDIDTLDKLVLEIKVYDEDFGRDDHIGEKDINLKHALNDGEFRMFEEELDKDRKGILRKDAKIHLKVKFDP